MGLIVGYDYSCGYSYKLFQFFGSLAAAGEAPDLDWRAFSLDQNDNLQGGDFKIWEHLEERTTSFWALAAARWLGRNVGREAFDSVHGRLFHARHEDHAMLDHETVLGLCGDHREAVAAAFADGSAAAIVAEEHTEFWDRWGLFGTPTLVFDEDRPLFVRLKGQWGDDALRIWERIKTVAYEDVLNELKRPPSWKPAELLGGIGSKP